MLEILVVALLTGAVLAAFSGKAFHIDDPLYLWSARHIRIHPLDFYGFNVHWYWTWSPIHEVINNPPLVPYFLALASLVVGWGEVGLHLSTALFAIAGAVGTYVLASRFCVNPLVATLAAVLTPVYLVCANTVMVDVPMLCLWVWAIVLWDSGLRSNRPAMYIASALLIAACALTKYFGASLIPLLLVYSIAKRRGLATLYLVIPLALLGLYEWWTHHLYGHGLFWYSATYPLRYQSQIAGPSVVSKAFVGLTFTGGAIISVLFFVHRMWSRPFAAIAALACAAAMCALIWLKSWYALVYFDKGGVHWPAVAQTAVFLTAGGLAFAAVFTDLWRRRDASSVLLALWIAGTFIFSTMLNWSVTARTILPMAPALGILIVRRIEDRQGAGRAAARSWKSFCPVACTTLVALAALWGDYTLANAARDAAQRAASDGLRTYATLWFQGHWGFQYYLQDLGGKPLDLKQVSVAPGDRMAMPATNSNIAQLSKDMLRVDYDLDLQPARWTATMNAQLGAGFHSTAFGPLPLAFGPVPPEHYRMYLIAYPAR